MHFLCEFKKKACLPWPGETMEGKNIQQEEKQYVTHSENPLNSTGVCMINDQWSLESEAINIVWTHQHGIRAIASVLMGGTLSHSAAQVVSGAEAVLGGLGAQVHHLVEAELAAIDWCCLRF